MQTATLFSRFLSALGVPHTNWYSDEAFRGMTFQSLYGLSHLLTEYGVKNTGVKFEDKACITRLATPFLAQTTPGIFVIVTKIDPATHMVEYDSRGEHLKVDEESFLKAWNGVALLAFPDDKSCEPDYATHHVTEIVQFLSGYALYLTAFAAFMYFFVTRQVYAHVSTVLLALFNCIGLYFSYMLVQKSLNIHTAASDHVCSVLEKGGCDTIVRLKVSKLFGVFSWSEIGFAYFSISLAALLMFPRFWPALALCNIFCLPYTCWSIWYQKFRARHWCTLCVGVQTTLWLLFFCYLGGGLLRQAWPLRIEFFVLADIYILTVLLLTVILRTFKNLPDHEKDSGA